MIEVVLARMLIDEKKVEQVIVLKEKNGKKVFPMVIGLSEAMAIKVKISKTEIPRPLTHDLLCDFFKTLSVTLDKVVIDNFKDGIFYAKLFLRTHDNQQHIVDARPSDSLALALRLASPIFVEEGVLDKLSS